MVNLNRRWWIGDLEITDYPFGVQTGDVAVDLGVAENETTTVATDLQDGELVQSLRTGNRALVIPVTVEGTDLRDLAANEAALKLACEQARNTITVDPGDTYGAPTVFDTFRIQPVRGGNDANDMALIRQWTLTIPALPWARSNDPTTVTFEPTDGDITEVDDCSTDTHWSSTSGAVSTSTFEGEGAVLLDLGVDDPRGFSLVWDGGVIVGEFVLFEYASASGSTNSNIVMLNGVGPIASVILGSNRRRLVFANPGTETLTFAFTLKYPAVDQYILDLSSSDSPPPANVMTADIGGSVRTPGAVTVTSPTDDPISDLMIFSDPAMLTYGYDPSLPETWAQAPEGCYTVYVSNSDTITGGVTVSAAVGSQVCSTRAPVESIEPADGTMRWVAVGDLDLGGRRDGRLGDFDVVVTVSGMTDPLAKVRLFRRWSPGQGVEETALTYVRGDVEGPVVVDIPSIDFPQGGVWVQELDALDRVLSWEPPTVKPPQAAVFVSDNGGPASELAVSMTFYKRWDGYAAE